MNLSFGILLRHRETGHYRYFIPYRNEVIFDAPQYISTSSDLLRIRRKLEVLDLESMLKRSRVDTKWEPVYITNIAVYVTVTSYSLGTGILPHFVQIKRSVKGLEIDWTTRRAYSDNLCLFRCLAYHDTSDERDASFDDGTIAK